MKNKYAWYKYREHTAGAVLQWQYIYLPITYKNHHNWIEDYLNSKQLLSTWSEHFRGVEIKSVKKVPAQVIKEYMDNARYVINSTKEEIQWLNKQLDLSN